MEWTMFAAGIAVGVGLGALFTAWALGEFDE